jgi:transposase InsO family protein
VLILENYYSPDELADQLDLLIEYYNNDRYHEALQNLTPADVYYGRSRDTQENQEKYDASTQEV